MNRKGYNHFSYIGKVHGSFLLFKHALLFNMFNVKNILLVSVFA